MARVRLLAYAGVAVVLVLAATAFLQVTQTPTGDLEGGVPVHAVLALVITLPLLLRTRYPVPVFGVVAVAGWLQFELGGGLGQPFFAVLWALYSVGAHAAAPLTWTGPAYVAVQAALVDVPRLQAGVPWEDVVPAWFVLLGVWELGRWTTRRRREAQELTERAEVAEREQHARAERAVADERARVARELHDLVAHSMGVIVIQAQGAQRALDETPERTRAALEAIESAGRAGLSEMRRLLGLLHESGTDSDTAPQPTLGQLSELVDAVRGAGLHVDLQVVGEARPLAAGVELTGYRVVQEALTNALKHAPGADVRVAVRYGSDDLEIEVGDDGSSAAAAFTNGGHGLVGMRERVGLYGGTLRAGPRPGGGFDVCARLPIGPPAEAL